MHLAPSTPPRNAAVGRRLDRLAAPRTTWPDCWNTERIASQTRRRIAGTTPDSATRVSVHDQRAGRIAKSRLGIPVPFGYTGSGRVGWCDHSQIMGQILSLGAGDERGREIELHSDVPAEGQMNVGRLIDAGQAGDHRAVRRSGPAQSGAARGTCFARTTCTAGNRTVSLLLAASGPPRWRSVQRDPGEGRRLLHLLRNWIPEREPTQRLLRLRRAGTGGSTRADQDVGCAAPPPVFGGTSSA